MRFIPNERRISEAGWNRSLVAALTQTFGDGRYVGDYFDGEETLDIILRSTPWETPEELGSIPVMTRHTGVLPLGELVDVVRTAGPEEIRRINRRRTVTLEVSPPATTSLEEALEIIRRDIEPQIMARLPADGAVNYGGVADRLDTALRSMAGSFILAITILYLLMSALFRSFRDSLLVILAVPLATFGGVLALRLVNIFTFQGMDLLTMIGFIILLGLVVNNAILLVHQGAGRGASGQGPAGGRRGGRVAQIAADHDEHIDQYLRHVAAAADPGRRHRTLPRPRGRGCRGHAGKRVFYPDSPALPVARRRGQAPGRGSRMIAIQVQTEVRLIHGKRNRVACKSLIRTALNKSINQTYHCDLSECTQR